ELLTIISFLGAAIILTLAPGPDNLFVLAQSIAKGKDAGVYTTLGLCTGILVHITAATIGLSAIIYHSTLAFSVVKYAGAVYLLYLAYTSFRDRRKIRSQRLEFPRSPGFIQKGVHHESAEPESRPILPGIFPAIHQL